MTSREDLIETANLAWHDASCPEGAECRSRKLHADSSAVISAGYVTAIVDAVLPQITTVEQFEALPIGTVVVDVKDRPWLRLNSEWWDHCGMVKPTHWLMLYPGVVTVVWQP